MKALVITLTLALLGIGPALAQQGGSAGSSGNAESNNKPASNSGTGGSGSGGGG